MCDFYELGCGMFHLGGRGGPSDLGLAFDIHRCMTFMYITLLGRV